MGICGSKDEAKPVVKPVAEPAKAASQPEKKLDPKDFMLQKLEGKTIVKEPGSIGGQQFIIEECKNCDIYVLDYSAAVNVDDCVDCRIFIGPCESRQGISTSCLISFASVFVRNTKNSRFVIACQQLRTRDCTGLDMLLYCSAGQPVVESSSGIRLGCFAFNYFSLRSQFEAAKLSPFDNDWSNVHDFTVNKDVPNWSFLPEDTKTSDLLKPLSAVGSNTQEVPGFVVPYTWGARPRKKNETCLTLVFSPHHDAVYDLLEKLKDSGIMLVRCRRTTNTHKAAVDKLVSGNKAAQKAASGGAVVALEFDGVKSVETVGKTAADLGEQKVFVVRDPGAAASACDELFAMLKM